MNRKMRSLISNGLGISGSWPQLTSHFWRCSLSINSGRELRAREIFLTISELFSEFLLGIRADVVYKKLLSIRERGLDYQPGRTFFI